MYKSRGTGGNVQWGDTKTLARSSAQDTREDCSSARVGSTKPLGFDESQCDGRGAFTPAAGATALHRSCMQVLLALYE